MKKIYSCLSNSTCRVGGGEGDKVPFDGRGRGTDCSEAARCLVKQELYLGDEAERGAQKMIPVPQFGLGLGIFV